MLQASNSRYEKRLDTTIRLIHISGWKLSTFSSAPLLAAVRKHKKNRLLQRVDRFQFDLGKFIGLVIEPIPCLVNLHDTTVPQKTTRVRFYAQHEVAILLPNFRVKGPKRASLIGSMRLSETERFRAYSAVPTRRTRWVYRKYC